MASPSKPIAGPSKQPSISSEPIVMQTFPLEPDSASYRRQRRKLPQEAYSILSNYFHTVSQDPDIHARRQLLAEIHKIPGADWYTSATLSQWFVSKRARMPVEQRRHIDGGISTDDILWPSFNASTIDMLRVLLDDTPSPTDAHFNVWSRTLRVERSHLLNWVQLYQADTSQVSGIDCLLPISRS
ncbi:hypothetical protein BDW22DRAFT_502181 [Trametopsis cervina]|nr:hypothetical protein BDW22DRAFT_502181 [Trametopsis cervina]